MAIWIENQMLKNLDDQIWEKSEYMAEVLGCKPLFGAVGGSISLNLANQSSDIDFYLVTETQTDMLQTLHYNDTKVDFICVELEDLQKECKKFTEKQYQYPTRFYRNESETASIMSVDDVERPDFKREMIMRIFLAEEILEFERGSVVIAYRKLRDALKLIDIWNYHFNRAYGNYHEKIKGKEKVLLRKYLYIISQISICHMILNGEEVIMDCKQVIERVGCICNNQEISCLCYGLWEENNQEIKRKNECYIYANPILDEWIEQNLDMLLYKMREKEKLLRENTYGFVPSKIRGLE